MDKIFKAYDMRGIYPEEINEDIANKAGMAFASYIKENYPEYNPVIGVARDSRLSSDSLFEATTKGVMEMGLNIIDLGMISTPALYFCSWFYDLAGAIMITASHNPKEYNGLKFVGPDAVPIDIKTGLDNIRDTVKGDNFDTTPINGKMTKKDPIPDYVENVLKPFLDCDFSNFKICVDTANAVPIIPTKAIFNQKDINADYIFDKIDGNFPNHHADPTIPANLIALKEKVKTGDYDLGIAFDGDGDRLIFVDKKGNSISPDIITALMCRIILKYRPKDRLLYDVSSSKIVPETIEKFGGEPIISMVGHSLIKNKMRAEDIYFGGEITGHYYLQDNKYCEAPFFVLFSVLKYLQENNKTLEDAVAEYQVYHSPGSQSIKISADTDVDKILNKLKEKYSTGHITDIDGFRVDYEDWWFLARKSNTEPLIRVMIEAKDESLIEGRLKEIKDIILG